MDDHDRYRYLDLLGDVVRERKWDCFGYCLMDNHVHLLIRTPEPDLGRGIQRVHSLFAQGFNERHGRIGHLFQGRFGSSRIRTGGRLRQVDGYITENPVVAGLCTDPAQWRWSSFGAKARRDAPKWLARRSKLEDLQEEMADS